MCQSSCSRFSLVASCVYCTLVTASLSRPAPEFPAILFSLPATGPRSLLLSAWLLCVPVELCMHVPTTLSLHVSSPSFQLCKHLSLCHGASLSFFFFVAVRLARWVRRRCYVY